MIKSYIPLIIIIAIAGTSIIISVFAELQENVQQIPTWIKHIFAMYAQELISDEELLNALQYLIQVGIIVL